MKKHTCKSERVKDHVHIYMAAYWPSVKSCPQKKQTNYVIVLDIKS